jgi:homoserine kinase
MPMSTVAGRALLPEIYPRADVTFNLSRVALLLGALQTGRFDALGAAMDDRVHQPFRQQIFPALRPLLTAARAAGAHGACLSGGGSSVLALVSEGAERVCAALTRTAEEAQTPGRCVIANISRQGATARLLADAEPEQRRVEGSRA